MSSEWPEVSLEELKAPTKSAFSMGPFGSKIKAENFIDHGVPVIKGGNLNGTYLDEFKFDYLAPEKAKELSSSIARRLDLVITHRGTLGQVGLIPESSAFPEYVVSQSQLKLSFAPEKVDPYFVYYFLRSSLGQRRLLANTSQVGVPAIAKALTTVRQIKLPLPPREEQRGVTAVLRMLDDRITLLRETNATLEAIAQALFKSWFVDFDPVHAKQQGRIPEGMDEATAALFPDSFEESELGLVPKGWSISHIEEVAEKVGMGPFGSNIKVSTFVSQGVPVLNGRNVQDTLLTDLDFNFITPSHAEKLKNSCVYAGDVVFTHRGTLGQVALIPEGLRYDQFVVSQSQFFLRCDRRRMVPEWITYFFKSPIGQQLLLANTSQVGVPSIARPVSHLRSIKLVLPPFEILSRFSETVSSLHKSVVANRQQAQTLAALRDTLLPRLISGQLRLPEPTSLIEEVCS